VKKVILIVVTLVSLVVTVLTWMRLKDAEAQLLNIGLHSVTFRCVDDTSGRLLEPRLFGLPYPEVRFEIDEESHEVTVYWAGTESDGDQLGASALGYHPVLLPSHSTNFEVIELRLRRKNPNQAEQDITPNR
jgi:hypothetical protein